MATEIGRTAEPPRGGRWARHTPRHGRAPVFVDASGRRTRVFRRLGLIVGVLLAAYLVLVGVSVVAGANVPLTSWPGGGAGGGSVDEETSRGADSPSAPPRVRPHDRGAAAPGTGTAAPRTGTAGATSGTTGAATSPGPAGTADGPGRSQADPPAYGRSKKPSGR